MNIKTVKFENGESFYISQFNDQTLNDLDYGVVMPDGTVIECSFGMHSIAYCIGITLYILKNCPDKFHDKHINLEKYIKENSKDGVLIDAYELMFSSWGLSLQLKYYETNENELFNIIQKTAFINAKNYKTNASNEIKKVAENWIKTNAKFIWGIRVFYLMKTDYYFWDDNEYPDWVKLMYENFGIEINKIQAKEYSAGEFRFKLPKEIIHLFKEEDKSRVATIIDNYAFYRDLMEVTPYYSSLWDSNFTETDLDHIIFKKFTP